MREKPENSVVSLCLRVCVCVCVSESVILGQSYAVNFSIYNYFVLNAFICRKLDLL